MLLLLFETSAGRYALDSKDVVEVIPLVKTKIIPAAPDYVAGFINYRSQPVPVFDLSIIGTGTPCRPLYSTRIILLRYPLAGDRQQLIGLIAERVTDVVKSSQVDIRASGILIDEDFNPRADETGNEEIIQWLDLRRMIPEADVREFYQE